MKLPSWKQIFGGPGTTPGDTPALADPHNLSSDITSADLVTKQTQPEMSEIDKVKHVKGKFEEARAGRHHLEDTWLESLATDIGGPWQWHYWDRKTQRFEDLRHAGEIDRYVTDNQVRPIILKIAALATTSKPDANPSGLTGRDIDQQAAQEARGVEAYCDREIDSDSQLRAMVDWVLRTTTVWLKCYWDPTKEAMVPVIDAQGSIVKIISAAVGDHCEEILSFAEAYPEPAKSHEKMRWFDHVSVRPISELVEHYGDIAYGIEPGSGNRETFGYLDSRLAFINGDLTGGSGAEQRRKTHALVIEHWEKPSPRYPKGLWATVAGDRCLRWSDLPDEHKGELPVIPLDFQKGIGTLYARNAVQDLIPLQRAMNRAWSRIVERMEADKLTVMVPEGAELDPDAFREPEGGRKMVTEQRDLRLVFHKPGFAPSMQQPPAINSEWFALPDKLLARMQNIAGIHDVSMGLPPSASSSGVQVNLLQQGDKSQLSVFTGNIESFVEKRSMWRIRHYAQYCKDNLPRLVGMSQSADPQQALAGAKSLTALTAGGQVRVKVTPGSAIPKFPEAQDARIMDMAKAGMFQPEQLPSTIAALKAMAMEGSDDLARDLLTVLQWVQQNAQAGQPNPAQVAQIKADQAAQAQALELQHEKDQAGIDLQNKIQYLDAETQAEIMKMHAERLLPPTVSLAGSMDPTAVVAAEREVGLSGKVPPMPTPSGTGKGASAGGRPSSAGSSSSAGK